MGFPQGGWVPLMGGVLVCACGLVVPVESSQGTVRVGGSAWGRLAPLCGS